MSDNIQTATFSIENGQLIFGMPISATIEVVSREDFPPNTAITMDTVIFEGDADIDQAFSTLLLRKLEMKMIRDDMKKVGVPMERKNELAFSLRTVEEEYQEEAARTRRFFQQSEKGVATRIQNPFGNSARQRGDYRRRIR